MNYLKEINAFDDEVELNSVSASAQLLWYVLMQYNNKTGWKREFTAPTSVILVKSALSESSFLRARKELQEKGYILFQAGKRNQAPVYQMISQVKEQKVNDVEDTQKEEVTEGMKDKPEDHTKVLYKRKERRENEGVVVDAASPHAFYEQNMGMLTPFMAEKITDWCDRLSDELVLESMRIAAQHNKLFFHYCEGILRRWEKANVRTLADIKKLDSSSKPPVKKREKDDRALKLKAMVDEFRKERRA
ncbi:DnaD domain protein [Halobacillus sp. Marseille-Q1614]|uniref:DnaD domain protein n=1 Tax=Halobacillus sp. Marseille-Q1614 TaxID=2709134 RepID=UPI00156FBB3E|nr:DnaD domain protein [Halobacillus sp. Marseille-Q1614]